MAIAPYQYGSRSDKHIVRLDSTVNNLRMLWYKDVKWESFNIHGESKRSKGVYQICDGGYLRWQTLMCPYAGECETGWRGYYNTNLESIRKDIEYTFGILKKMWRILDYGLNLYCMNDCEKKFTVCCILHNTLLKLGEQFGMSTVAGRGAPYGNDGLWLEGRCSWHVIWLVRLALLQLKQPITERLLCGSIGEMC